MVEVYMVSISSIMWKMVDHKSWDSRNHNKITQNIEIRTTDLDTPSKVIAFNDAIPKNHIVNVSKTNYSRKETSLWFHAIFAIWISYPSVDILFATFMARKQSTMYLHVFYVQNKQIFIRYRTQY